MKSDDAPVNLDQGIDLEKKENKSSEKHNKIPWIFFVGGAGLVLIIVLLFIQPSNSTYIDSPPPEEQAERDSIYKATLIIQEYTSINDSLPGSVDISIPANLTYQKQDAYSWFIETETEFYYSSDMDPDSFRLGKI